MITREEAEIRVARGAAHLDKVRPGWFNRIDVGTLTLHDPCGCVLGQLTGSDVWIDRSIVFGMDERALCDNGFDLSWLESELMRESVSSAEVFATLQDAWIEAIAARRHPVTQNEQSEPVCAGS